MQLLLGFYARVCKQLAGVHSLGSTVCVMHMCAGAVLLCRTQVCFMGGLTIGTKSGTSEPLGFCLYVLLFVGKAVAVASELAAHTWLCLAHLAVLMCEMRTAFVSACTRSNRRSRCPTKACYSVPLGDWAGAFGMA